MSADDKKKRSSTETARRIWLAGIGAYGRAFTEAQGALKDVTGKSSDVFDDLVQKGEMIEKVVEHKGREILDKAKIGDLDVPSFEIDERIKRMRTKLSVGNSSSHKGQESVSVSARLDEMDYKIQELTQRIAMLEPKKTVRAKTKVSAKTVTQRTNKTSSPD